MNLKINAIEVNQPIGKFYICKLDSKILVEMSKVDIMKIANNSDTLYDGIQRGLNRKKVKHIANYLSAYDATFPNSVIVNVDNENFIGYTNGIIELKRDRNTFTILDGQHRLEGLKECNINNFDVVLSIFVGLKEKDCSRVFVTINTEQTKINPSQGLYQELYDDIYTPRKMIVKIAEMFCTDNNSPWRKLIKLKGNKDELAEDGILSLKAFATPIINKIYDDDQQFQMLRNILIDGNNDFTKIRKNILWDLYNEKNETLLYKVLFNYFDTLKSIFNHDWGRSYSLITKTTGYNAMMILFEDLYKEGLRQGDLSKEFFKNKLHSLESLNGKINSKSEYSLSPSGESAANDLYKIFKEVIDG